MQSRIDDISKIIKEQIKNYSKKTEQDEVGYVISVGDGISKVHGIDKEYEDELTKVSGEYLISIFYNKNKVGEAKEELMNVMSKKQPTHTSNLLNIML